MPKKLISSTLLIIFCTNTMAQSLYDFQTLLASPLPAYSKRILFVCGGNTGRSPMAESLANDYFDFPRSGYVGFSRGVNVNPQEKAPEKNAVIVTREWSIYSRIKEHHATPITVADINQANIILTMTQSQKEKLLLLDPSATNKTWMLSQCANGTKEDVSDMYGHDLEFYQKTSKQIAHYLELIKKHKFTCK